MRKYAFLIVLGFLFICGCGGDKSKFTEEQLAQMPFPQKQGLPQASGGFVLVVAGQTITSDEIIVPALRRLRPTTQMDNFEGFKESVKDDLEQILMTKVANVLLYSKAKENASNANIDELLEKAVETELRKFVVRFGSDYAKAEQALKQMGMDWKSFKEYQKKAMLSQSYMATELQSQMDRPITHSQMLEAYNQMKKDVFAIPATFEFRLIDIEPAKLELTDPNQSRLQVAKGLAYELITRINLGEDFAELAKQYSHGYRRNFGGLWKPVQFGSLASPFDVLEAEARKVEPGQIVGPIEVPGHIFIMKLEDKQLAGFEPFEKVQDQVKTKIVIDQRRKAIDEFNKKLVQQTELEGKDEFVEFCLGRMYAIVQE